MIKKIISSIGFWMMATSLAWGQDIHFSQFFAAPLTVNPASAGALTDDWRIGLNYKNQWPWGSELTHRTYRTISFYGDAVFLRDQLLPGDWIGAGGYLLYDQAGDGDLATTKLLITGAYHKSLNADNSLYLTVGFGGGYIQKKVDYDKLYFDRQWSGEIKDFSLEAPSGEAGKDKLSYLDINAGAKVAYAPSEKWQAQLGAGFLHLNTPKESFDEKSHRRRNQPARL